jgi:hypothetical protein
MAIKLEKTLKDAQGLPVVTWEEDRNHFAPEGAGCARVTCFLRPDEEGVLQFVAAGSVRHGPFEDARPWELLQTFAKGSADELYYSAEDRALLQTLANKIKGDLGRLPTTDGAQVLLANFLGERLSDPMHINCASCASVDMAVLHDRLRLEFIDRRPVLLQDICDGDYRWSEDKPPFKAYVPPPQATVPPRVVRAMDASIVAAFGLIGFGLYWWLLR